MVEQRTGGVNHGYTKMARFVMALLRLFRIILCFFTGFLGGLYCRGRVWPF